MSEESPSGGDSGGVVRTVVPDVVRRSFALKFAIALLVMGVAVGGIGLVATEQITSETRENVEERYASIALQEADIIEQWVERNSLSTRLVSGESIWAGNQSLNVAVANERSSLPSGVRDVHLLKRNGSGAWFLASTSVSDGTSAIAAGHPWLNRVAFSNSSAVQTSPVWGSRTSGYRIGFASPIDDAPRRFIVVEYDLSAIASSLRGAERANGGFTQVVARDGTVVLSEGRNGSSVLGDDITKQYATSEAARRPIRLAESLRTSPEEAGVIPKMPASDVIGEPYTVGYSPVNGTDWVVAVHAPYASVFGFVQRIQQWGLVATVVEVLLVGAVGALLGWRTATSIDRLTAKTDEIREGNLDVDLSTDRIDNIGRLHAGFASMRDSLKEQIEDAKEAREEAEQSRAEAVEMNEYLEKKADEFGVVMERAAAGDLTERMDTDGEHESMDRIAREFNDMIEELEKTTGQLESFAEEVAESGDVVLERAESVREASEEVSDAVDAIATDAQTQEQRLATLSEDIDDLVDEFRTLEAESSAVDLGDSIARFEAVADALRAAADTTRDVKSTADAAARGAEKQRDGLDEVTERADKLKRYARPIGDIVGRFETEAEHEFVFSGGPSQSPEVPERDD